MLRETNKLPGEASSCLPTPDGSNSLAKGHPAVADKASIRVPDASDTIAAIHAWHRKRMFVMETRKRADLALGSALRTWLGWRRDNEKAVNDRIRDLASNLIDCGEKLANSKPHDLADTDEWKEHGDIILAAILSRGATDAQEKMATKEMERLAKSLPVWAAFGEGVRGFGARSLAVIVGEAGDLGQYATKSKLWKRMGLAVMDGIRQGGLSKNAGAEAWIAHGYNAKRRAMMFVIGDVLVKQGEHYRQVYLDRKQYERAMAVSNGLIVAPAAKIPEKRKHEFISDGHIHRRAQRYMEKRLLRDLWKAWRETAMCGLPQGHRSNASSLAS